MQYTAAWHAQQRATIAKMARSLENSVRQERIDATAGTFAENIDGVRRFDNNAKVIEGKASDLNGMVQRYLRALESEAAR